MINLAELGTSYTLHQPATKETSIVHVVLYDDILTKTNPPPFVSIDQYSRVHISALKHTRPLTNAYYNVSWHVSTEEKFDITSIVAKCRAEKNDIVIVEIIRD